jgi:uncharacterized protein (TIGR02646 family)
LDFPDHWNEMDVRGALLAMHGWTCAYCHRELDQDRRGDVDHFRPKSAGPRDSHQGYWWLAYAFENYLLSCSTCNSVHKGSRFPLKPGASAVDYGSRARLSQEERLLVEPALDAAERWLRVDCADDLCPVVVSAEDPDSRLKAETTAAFFKLNDRPLVTQRKKTLARALGTYEKKDFETLRRSASTFQPHGATVRALLVLLEPEVQPPSPDEELAWLLEDVDGQLRLDERLRGAGVPPASERFTQELLWMLAVLWKHPPALDVETIEAWLSHTGWKPRVEPLYAQLQSP